MKAILILLFVFIACIFTSSNAHASGYWATASSSIYLSDVGKLSDSGFAMVNVGYDIVSVTATNDGTGQMTTTYSGSNIEVNWSGGVGETTSSTEWRWDYSNTTCGSGEPTCNWTKSIPPASRNVSFNISQGSASYDGNGTIAYFGFGAPNNPEWNMKHCSATASGTTTQNGTSSSSCGFGVIADIVGPAQSIISPSGAGYGAASCSSKMSLYVEVTAYKNKTATNDASCEFQRFWYDYSGSAMWEYPVTSDTTTWSYSGTVQYTYRYWVANSPPSVVVNHDAPTPLYRGTTVTFQANAFDADGDIVSQGWTGLWSGIGSRTYTTTALGSVTTSYYATDNLGETTTASATVSVVNRLPTVSVTNPSSSSPNYPTMFSTKRPVIGWQHQDEDGDAQSGFQLRIYRYGGILQQDSGVITTSASQWTPTIDLPENVDFYVVARSFDGFDWGNYSEPTFFRITTNRAPIASFGWTPALIYEGDVVQLINTTTDPDQDAVTYQWKITDPLGTLSISTHKNLELLSVKRGMYTAQLRATDAKGAYHEITRTFTVQDLAILGQVGHTSEWEAYRQSWNSKYPLAVRASDEFWAGEALVLRARVTDTTVSGTKAQGVTAELLTTSNIETLSPLGTGDFGGTMIRTQHAKQLVGGTHVMRFTVQWSNGHVEYADVSFRISGRIEDVIVNQQRL
jgi:hypothetical protein